MSALTAVVYIGARPPLGGGLKPAVVAHLYEGGVPRFVAHEVTERDSGAATATGDCSRRAASSSPTRSKSP